MPWDVTMVSPRHYHDLAGVAPLEKFFVAVAWQDVNLQSLQQPYGSSTIWTRNARNPRTLFQKSILSIWIITLKSMPFFGNEYIISWYDG